MLSKKTVSSISLVKNIPFYAGTVTECYVTIYPLTSLINNRSFRNLQIDTKFSVTTYLNTARIVGYKKWQS